MEWEAIADRLAEFIENLLSELNQDIIDTAEENPDTVFELDQSVIDQIEVMAQEAEADIQELAIEDFPDDTGESVDFNDESSKVIFFYLLKVLTDGISAIHSATVTRQVLEGERTVLQQAALARSFLRIRNAARTESSSTFALKHQQIAIASDFGFYVYNTSEDEAVRSAHNARNQRVFAYGQERTVDDIPGLANNCRCFATPVTVEEALTFPFFYPEDRPQVSAKKTLKAKKLPFVIKALMDVVTIDVEGFIDDWDHNDYLTFSSKVKAYLDNEDQELHVNITSWGGNAVDGLQVHDLLKSLPNRVVANIYGYAGSAATHFAVAADHTTIGEFDEFFMHQSHACACGNKQDFSNIIDAMEDIDDRQVMNYVDKTGLSEQEVVELLSTERTLTAQEALDLGFVDEIREDSQRSRAARGEVQAKALKGAIQARKPNANDEVKPMKLAEILKALKADKSLKAELIAELESEIESGGDDEEIKALKKRIDDLDTSITEKDSTIEALKTQVRKANDDDGEVTDEQREEIKAELRDEIKAEVTKEIEEETEKVNTLTSEIQAAGLKVEGTEYKNILVNAIKALGGITEKDGKELPVETLDNIWASVNSAITQSSNDADIKALNDTGGDGNDGDGKTKSKGRSARWAENNSR